MVDKAPHTSHLRGRIRRLVAGVSAAAALTAASLTIVAPGTAQAATGSCANANVAIAGASHAAMQQSVVCLINQRRASFHLPKLVADTRLDLSAQRWTNDMVTHADFTHGAGAAFSDRISAVGFNWSNAGENIATGFETPNQVVAAWMASTGHCQNILSPVYREVGTGLANGMIAGASNVDGTWTQDFGLLMGQHPASANYGPAEGCPYN
jgi:uncharacterized protein YkwD